MAGSHAKLRLRSGETIPNFTAIGSMGFDLGVDFLSCNAHHTICLTMINIKGLILVVHTWFLENRQHVAILG